jgi:hypothetical protein
MNKAKSITAILVAIYILVAGYLSYFVDPAYSYAFILPLLALSVGLISWIMEHWND